MLEKKTASPSTCSSSVRDLYYILLGVRATLFSSCVVSWARLPRSIRLSQARSWSRSLPDERSQYVHCEQRELAYIYISTLLCFLPVNVPRCFLPWYVCSVLRTLNWGLDWWAVAHRLVPEEFGRGHKIGAPKGCWNKKNRWTKPEKGSRWKKRRYTGCKKEKGRKGQERKKTSQMNRVPVQANIENVMTGTNIMRGQRRPGGVMQWKHTDCWKSKNEARETVDARCDPATWESRYLGMNVYPGALQERDTNTHCYSTKKRNKVYVYAT